MRNLANIIGPSIANDLYASQAAAVDAACDENENGVRRVAAAITADPSIRSPTPALLARLRRGAHRTAAPPRRPAAPRPIVLDEPYDAIGPEASATRARELAAQIRRGALT